MQRVLSRYGGSARLCANVSAHKSGNSIALKISRSGCRHAAPPVPTVTSRTSVPSAPSRRSVVVEAKANEASTVKITIQGRKLEVTDAIRGYVEEKVQRAVGKFAHTIKKVDVTISARGGDTGTHGKKEQKVDVTLFTLRNGVVRVEDAEENLYASVDIVCDKLWRKMTKVKERAISRGSWPGHAADKGQGKIEEETDYQEYMQEVLYETQVFDRDQQLKQQFDELNRKFPTNVRRYKVVDLEPISVDDAIEALEAVDHDFFVYRDQGTNEVQVVYRRSEDGYGVIVPKKKN